MQFKSSIHIFIKISILLSTTMLTQMVVAEEDSPYSFEAVYTADYFENIEGGVKEGGAYLDNFDLIFDIDTGKLWNIGDGTTLHIHLLHNNSNTFSDLVGDTQVVSNIDNTDVIRLYEFWWQQNRGNHSVKFGLYDLNSEFDAIEPASLFINSSHGIGADYSQSGENGPSIFPTTSLALRYSYQANDNLNIQSAILDGSSGDPDDPKKNTIDFDTDDLLIALEVNYTVSNTRFGLGTWHYTKKTETLDAMHTDNNSGAYGIIKHQFLNTDKDNKSLNGWIRVGRADKEINQIESYFGAGLVLSNFIQSRRDDSIGFAIAQARNSDKFRALSMDIESSETVFELTYNAPINEYIIIQPDIQYIKNPGTNLLLDDALVVGVRLEIAM